MEAENTPTTSLLKAQTSTWYSWYALVLRSERWTWKSLNTSCLTLMNCFLTGVQKRSRKELLYEKTMTDDIEVRGHPLENMEYTPIVERVHVEENPVATEEESVKESTTMVSILEATKVGAGAFENKGVELDNGEAEKQPTENGSEVTLSLKKPTPAADVHDVQMNDVVGDVSAVKNDEVAVETPKEPRKGSTSSASTASNGSTKPLNETKNSAHFTMLWEQETWDFFSFGSFIRLACFGDLENETDANAVCV